MKSIILSIKPYWYYLIFEGIKTYEIRKKVPNNNIWDKKVKCYMSKDEKSFNRIPKEFQNKFRKHFGKVGMEFYCGKKTTMLAPKVLKSLCDVSLNQFLRKTYERKSCLSINEIIAYSNGKNVYALEITRLNVIEKPKELSKFNIKKAPQSWQYLEGIY